MTKVGQPFFFIELWLSVKMNYLILQTTNQGSIYLNFTH